MNHISAYTTIHCITQILWGIEFSLKIAKCYGCIDSFCFWISLVTETLDKAELKLHHFDWCEKHWKDWKFLKGEIKYGSWQLFIIMKWTSKRLMHLCVILSYVNYICDYDSMQAHLLYLLCEFTSWARISQLILNNCYLDVS